MVNVESVLKQEYPSLFKYPRIFSDTVTNMFRWVLHENTINHFLEAHSQTKGIEFIESVMSYLNISYKTIQNQLENIPTMGKVIIVANHPLGALDALSMIHMVHSIREDKKVKIVANKILSSIPQLKEFLIPVDNMNDKLSKHALKEIDAALQREEAVIFFPSGEVSRKGMFGIKEGSWKSGFIKFAKRNHTPILPVYIRAKNSKLFYTLSSIYKPLGTLLLSHEMFAARDQIFDITIGKIVSDKVLSDFTASNKRHAQQFRKHLLRIARGKKGIYPTESAISHPVSRQEIRAELKRAERIGTTSDHKHIYLVEYENIPNLMNEIGRLREYSFRKVGEGSGKSKDIDQYDRYYHHLVLWDDDALEVVGSYRIGECGWIVSWLGREGLYLNELCEIDEKFDTVLEDAIELGRSFVQPKYWGSRALDYLWQGIGAYLSHNPHIKYMIGPVSISGSYPQYAQAIIVYFYQTYFGSNLTCLKARSPFKLSDSQVEEFEAIFSGDDYQTDFKMLKDYLKTFDVSIPTLYKQYTELCTENGAQFIDFGIDADFNHCIDGYIMVEINKIKDEKRKRYINNSL